MKILIFDHVQLVDLVMQTYKKNDTIMTKIWKKYVWRTGPIQIILFLSRRVEKIGHLLISFQNSLTRDVMKKIPNFLNFQWYFLSI